MPPPSWPHRLWVRIEDFQSSEQGSSPCGAAMESIIDYTKDLIKITMDDLGISSSELSQRLGKDKSQISRILNSDSDMTLTTVDSIFTAMGVKIGFVLEYEE